MARLVYLGTPEAAVRAVAHPGGRRTRRRPGGEPRRQTSGSGRRPRAEPGQGRGPRARTSRHRRPRRRHRRRRRAGRGGGLRTHHPRGRPRAAAHGQPPLLAAAPLARCGPGRAGDPRGRRRDGGLPDGRRGRSRHRPRLRRSGHGHRPRRVGRGAAEPPGRHRLPAAGASTWPRAGPACRCPGTRQAIPTYAEKIAAHELELDFDPARVELRRVVRLGRAWTTFRGQRLRVLSAAPGRIRRATGRRRVGPGPALDPGGSTASTWVPGEAHRLVSTWCSPRGKRAMAASDWMRGVQSATRRPPGIVSTGRYGSAAMATVDTTVHHRHAHAAGGAVDPVGRLRQPGRCRGPGDAGHRLAPRRRDGRPLRAQPDHRPAGRGLVAGPQRPVLRHPPHDHRPGRATSSRSATPAPTAARCTWRWGRPPRSAPRCATSGCGWAWPPIPTPRSTRSSPTSTWSTSCCA